MADNRKNIKVGEDDFRLLKACKPGGENWGRFLTQAVRKSSPHTPVATARENRPLPDYVSCDECGRSENTLEELDRRPCDPSGISINE